MTDPKSPELSYTQERDRQAQERSRLTKKRNRLGWLRLSLILFIILLTIKAFGVSVDMGIVCLIAGVAAFLVLVSIDVKNSRQLAHVQVLLQINEAELQVLQGNFQDRFDGSMFLPHLHPYAADLDLFGTASLYQYINRCNSEQGQALFAQNLLEGLPVNSVIARQEAVIELTPQLQWCQQLQALSLQAPLTKATQQKTETWLVEPVRHFTHKAWPVILAVYSTITLLSAVAALFGFIPLGLFSGLFGIYLVIATSLSGKATKAYTQLNGIVKEITTVQQVLQCVEEKDFKAPHINALKQAAGTKRGQGHEEIKKLQALLNRFDMRLNIYVFLFLNSFLLWDVRQMIALNRWRQQNKEQVNHWFQLIAEMEVLNSLATLHFNQPTWSWPQFAASYFTFSGTAVGHPLLPAAQRITNDFQLQGTAKVALITGSNMAGKSTFLRSLGVNLVLAQLGAPVCAQQLTVSPVQVMSSMRIADNLAENTSTFYAELKKLKTIIDAMKEHRPLFILLDEVLRGTNSLDRHIGSKALIRQIIKEAPLP